MTMGVLVSNKIYNASHPNFIAKFNFREEKKQTQLKKKLDKEVVRYSKLRDNVISLCQKQSNPGEWTATKCKSFLQYKKKKGDSAMPKRLDDLCNRCIEVSGQALPVIPIVEIILQGGSGIYDDDDNAEALLFDPDEALPPPMEEEGALPDRLWM